MGTERLHLWNADPDGIYLFNSFVDASIDPFRELGDLETMAQKDKMFGVDRFGGDSSFSDVREVELPQGEPVRAEFQVGEDIESGNVPELLFRLHFWDFAPNDDIVAKLNDQPFDGLEPAGPAQESGGQWLECRLNPAQVMRGDNKVELMVSKRDDSMQTPLILDTVQLRVHYGNGTGISSPCQGKA